MAEEKNRSEVLSIKKDSLSLQQSQASPAFFDIPKTKQCASFSHNGNLRNSTRENGECRTVVSLLRARTSVIFRFQGFLRTSVRRI